MKPYTVIGYYEDNGQGFAEHVEAEDAHAAFAAIAARCGEDGDLGGDLVLVGAIEGSHMMASPCEDAERSTCAAVDYPAGDAWPA